MTSKIVANLVSRDGALSRRKFLKLVVGSISAGLLAACVPQTPPAAQAPEAAAPASESQTLTLWAFQGTFEGIQSQVGPFTEKHSQVKVDIQPFGYSDVHTNLLNAIVAGSGAPDLCAIDVLTLTQYIDGLTDLSELATPYADQFVPPTFALGSYQGKFYGLATDSEPMGLLYRKDLWDQYGIKEEDINTWSDLAAAGDQVNQASQGEVSLYHQSANDSQVFEMMAVEQGFPGYFFNEDDTQVIVDDPKMVEVANALKALWDGKGVLQNPGGGSYGDEMTVLLKNGKVTAQIIGAAWFPTTLTSQMPELSGKWRLMRAPAVTKDGPRIGYQYPTIFVIPKESKQPEVAWELARMGLIGDGAKSLFEITHILPAYLPLLEEIRDTPDEYFGGQTVFQLWDAITRDVPDVFFGTGFTEAQEILGNHLQTILSGEKSAEDGLADAAEEMRAKLNKG